MLTDNVRKCGHAEVIAERRVIDFGSQATFTTGDHRLTPTQIHNLRECVPEVLAIAANELGKKWIKRIAVEGFADPRGGYLYNLNLSLQRSQRVLCALLLRGGPNDRVLTAEERKQVRDLFLVGGYSFNDAKDSLERSRRVELRLEFWSIGEPRTTTDEPPGADSDTVCQLDVRPATAPAPAPPPAPTPTPPSVFSPFR